MEEGVLKLRIISGKYKGKKIEGFDIDGTRATQDRVKESLFGIIQDYIYDSSVLDLFTGSGNLGLEAISNGASSCYFVDNNSKCIDMVTKNVKGMEFDSLKIIKSDYREALIDFKNKRIKFDIVFLDPPYNLDCLDYVISYILDNDLLNSNGLIVCEYENDNFKDNYPNLFLWKEKKYGYKNIRIYVNEG